jgi:3-keto-disaccharide hydrolase
MRTHLRTAIVGFILIVSPTAILADQKVELFNGKDLTGWTKRGGNGSYKVEEGEIVGRSAPNTTNTFLCTDKEFGDFELELDFKIDPKQNIFNSGVQIRSHSRPEGDQERVYGYQVEIDTKKDRPWTGGIYFEGGSKDKKGEWIRKGQWLNDLEKNKAAQNERHLGKWNQLKIVAKGNRIQTWVNGVPAADFTDKDEKAFSPKGFIALQVHAVGKLTDSREVRFKNIKLTKLD